MKETVTRPSCKERKAPPATSSLKEVPVKARTSLRLNTSSSLVFFDVDGTLTYRSPESGPTNIPRPTVQQAIHELVGNDHIAVLCTGRGTRRGIGQVLASMPFRGFVMLDGAYVTLDGSTIVDKRLSPASLRATLSEMCRVGMSCLLSGKGGSIVLAPRGVDSYARNPLLPRATTANEALKLSRGFGIAKVDFTDDDYERYLQSPFLIEQFDHYNVGDGYHELAMHGVNKGTGSSFLLSTLVGTGFIPDRTYAFGDSENDISLFNVADVSIAMGQADERIRKQADYVTASASEDGVVSGLRHFGLI